MRLRRQSSRAARRLPPGWSAGFSVIEMLFVIVISAVILGGVMQFIFFTAKAVSGVTAQTVINQKAGHAIEFIQSRVRFATFISNSVSGNALTLGFDDDYNTDSDSDKIAYNDKNHYERFEFIGRNSTNVTLCASNKLVYYPNTSSSVSNVLIPSGVRNLPNSKIFYFTNQAIVVFRFGVADSYSRDNYQSVDVQGTGVSLNRPATNNMMTYVPY